MILCGDDCLLAFYILKHLLTKETSNRIPRLLPFLGGYKMQLDPRIGWDLGREIFTSKSGDRAPHLDLKNAQHDGSCRPNIQHCARHLIQIGLQLIMQLSWQKRLGYVGVLGYRWISTNHTSTSSCRARFAHGKKKAPEMEMVPWDSHFNLTEETDSRAVCKGQRPLMLPLIIFLSLVNLLTSENSKNHWNHWVSPQFMMFWYMSWYMLTVWMWQSCLSAPQEAPLSPPSSPSSPSSPWARHRWKGIGVFLKFLVWPPGL